MPTGPQGQKRPSDPARNALKILKLATGELEEALEPSTSPHHEPPLHKQPRTKQKPSTHAKAKS